MRYMRIHLPFAIAYTPYSTGESFLLISFRFRLTFPFYFLFSFNVRRGVVVGRGRSTVVGRRLDGVTPTRVSDATYATRAP